MGVVTETSKSVRGCSDGHIYVCSPSGSSDRCLVTNSSVPVIRLNNRHIYNISVCMEVEQWTCLRMYRGGAMDISKNERGWSNGHI